MVRQAELQKAFGRELRRLRMSRGISQEKLALECGLDRTFISLLERGQRQPSLTTVFVLAEALDIAPSQMVKNIG